MQLCRQCSRSPLPFIMVIFVAGVIAFLTWLTLAYSQLGELEVIAGTCVVFLAVATTMLHYVMSCMRRHCNHGDQNEHRQGAAH